MKDTTLSLLPTHLCQHFLFIDYDMMDGLIDIHEQGIEAVLHQPVKRALLQLLADTIVQQASQGHDNQSGLSLQAGMLIMPLQGLSTLLHPLPSTPAPPVAGQGNNTTNSNTDKGHDSNDDEKGDSNAQSQSTNRPVRH